MTVTNSYVLKSQFPLDPGTDESTAIIPESQFGLATLGVKNGVASVSVITPGNGSVLTHFEVAGVGPNASIAEMPDSRQFVIVSQDADSIVYKILSRDGQVLSTVDIGVAGSTHAKVAALDGGGFIIANERAAAGGDSDVEFRVYNNAGALVRQGVLDTTNAVDQGADVTALAGGGWAVSWTRTVGTETEIWYATYNTVGGVVQPMTLLDTVGTINRNASRVTTAAGFAMAYETNDTSGGIDVRVAQFDTAGALIRSTTFAHPGDDSHPDLTQLSNGFLGVAFENGTGGEKDIDLVVIDPATGAVLASNSFYGGAAAGDDAANPGLAATTFGQMALVQTDTTAHKTGGESIALVHVQSSDDASDTLTGSDLIDLLLGNGGNDILIGGGPGFFSKDVLDGGDGNDELHGNGLLIGGAGDDWIDGTGGVDDTASYADAPTAVTVDLAITDWQDTGGAGHDKLTNIEIVVGSKFDDRLFGADGPLGSVIGRDTLVGGEGNDYLDGRGNNNTLMGGAGDDLLEAGGGNNDILDGGQGNDTVSYATSDRSVDVRVDFGGGGDTFVSIENLTGSAFNDILRGDAGANVLKGGAGNDSLYGGLGNDMLDGGEGNDAAFILSSYAASQVGFANGVITIDGPDGHDTLTGVNTVYFYTGSNGQGLIVDKIFDVRYNGQLAADSRQTIVGTPNADTLIGGQSGDSLSGDAGNDIFIGGEGNDTYFGGAGSDTARYAGLLRSYDIALPTPANLLTVESVIDGTDRMSGVDILSFVDGRLFFGPDDAASQLYRLYDTVLNRAPDTAGLSAWLQALDSGVPLTEVANAFATGSEFVQYFGNLTNQQFVERLYLTTFGRAGDANGIAQWTNALNGGASRGQVSIAFSETGEHKLEFADLLKDGVWIEDGQTTALARLYDATFDRLPDAKGLEDWRAALAGGTSLTTIAAAFAGSGEFQARYGNLSNQGFVEQLYRFTLNREGEAQGVADWVNYLNTGGSRASLLLQFSESGEHVALTQPLWDRGIHYLGTDPVADPPPGSPINVELVTAPDLHNAAVGATAAAYDPVGDEGLASHAPHDFALHDFRGGDVWLVG